MNWRETGDIGPRALVFGGPYSNLQSTESLLAQALEMGFDMSQLICTGDTVAYCANPSQTVARLRAAGCVFIAGNCEKQLAKGADDCGCGFDADSTCDRLSGAWYAYASRQLDQSAKDWMGNLPDVLVFTLGGKRCAVLHGGISDVSQFLWPSSEINVFRCELHLLQSMVGPVDCVFAGHCGIAFHHRIDNIDWINAGAIGMPPHDGRAETRFVVIDAEGPTFYRLAYDATEAQAAMRSAGLTHGYDAALTSGIWPSEDALPKILRR